MARTKTRGRRSLAPALTLALAAAMAAVAPASWPRAVSAQDAPTPHVVLVTIDGARWQDVFGGLDLDVLKSTIGRTPVERTQTYTRFWAPTAAERRARVMPFLWNRLVAGEGAIAGNRAIGSRAEVANTMRFSYPGYSEILTGAPHDDHITSNDNKRYPYLTVLEWLRQDLGVTQAQIALFGSWETFRFIGESQPGAIAINAGFEAYAHPDPHVQALSELQFQTPNGFDGARHDVYTFRFGMAHLQTARPRVLYFAFDETDDWAHLKRYDLVLDALHRTDRQLEQLWTWLQSDAEYRGTTTLIVTVDHGRGRTPADWIDHGTTVPGSNETWLGCFGPRVEGRGERRGGPTVQQRQIAATIAALLGRDFRTAVPGAGAPVAWCGADG